MACLFCDIVAGRRPATVLHRDDLVTAFRDLRPQAPVHVLIVPNEHIPSAADVSDEHGALMARLFLVARQMAEREGVDGTGYRLVCNVGADAGQSVNHLHMHLLGARRLAWPPG